VGQVNELGYPGLPSLLMIFSGPESEKKTQLPFKTSKTILNKIKIAMIHWTGNEAITYICKTVMHLYFDFLC
jgi:ABC-type proline/glycine betaine transport system substrate-binding protein